MAARDAVFNTYELLENIIAHLPGNDIFRAQTVNKTWYSVTRSSKTIHRGVIISPTLPTPPEPSSQFAKYALQKQMERLDFFRLPNYSSLGITIQMHPQLVGAAVNLNPAGMVSTVGFRLDPMTDGQLEPFRKDYISSPRCCAIGMSFGNDLEPLYCSVYARGGVRIQHVLEVYMRLRRYNHARIVHLRLITGISFGREATENCFYSAGIVPTSERGLKGKGDGWNRDRTG